MAITLAKQMSIDRCRVDGLARTAAVPVNIKNYIVHTTTICQK